MGDTAKSEMYVTSELKEAKNALELCMRAFVLTRDYVGSDMLPPIPGWEWFDACKRIEKILGPTEWVEQFNLRLASEKERRRAHAEDDGVSYSD